ncbi:thermonuclease family protein [Candidatus Parcubacteria bacterium]|nr:thermonuclease family protein [Candidatus Parcubacteria bacterium]
MNQLKKIYLFFKLNYQIFLFLLFCSIPAIYLAVDNFSKKIQCTFPSEVLVTKIIDGDTILVEGGKVVRILGIDCDEEGYPCFEAAKKRTEEFLLNKKVKIERGKTSQDKYKRCLGYVFLNGENIGLKLVQEGLAVCRNDSRELKYERECKEKEREAIEKKIGCKWQEIQFSNVKKVSACAAKKYYGERVLVEGKVVQITQSKNNTLFLNFEKKYPHQCFSAVIFSADLQRFPKDLREKLLNKTVKIFGPIQEYKGKPEIILKHPNQIILEE